MSDIKYLKYTSVYGESITFMDHGEHKFTGRIKGLGNVPVKPLNAKGYEQQGLYNFGVNAGPRTIAIDAMVTGSSINTLATLEADIESVLNPENGSEIVDPTQRLGRIDIETKAGNKYFIPALVIVLGDFEIVESSYSEEYPIQFLCPKPDWLGYEPKTLKMSTLVGGLTYPKTYPITYAEIGTGGEIDYQGINPAEILFDFRVAEGGVSMTQPKVSDPDGNNIELDITLLAGEKVLVDTNPDKPSITFIDGDGVESDAYNDIIWEPTFFLLFRGTNIFTFTAQSGDPEVYATWYEHFRTIK